MQDSDHLEIQHKKWCVINKDLKRTVWHVRQRDRLVHMNAGTVLKAVKKTDQTDRSKTKPRDR